MDGWWNEIEGEILSCLDRHDELTPSELGHHLGMSASAAASLLAILASDGKVNITSVTLNRTSVDAGAPTDAATTSAPIRQTMRPKPASRV